MKTLLALMICALLGLASLAAAQVWTPQVSGTTQTLAAMSFVGPDTGWACGASE